MTDGPVLSASRWNTNADMIVDMHKLHYIDDDDWVLDPTYEKGIWWKKYRPRRLCALSNVEGNPYHRYDYDFRNIDFLADEIFDVIAYDPPYVSVGGRKTSGIESMYEGYGLVDAPDSPSKLQDLIDAGLAEMERLVVPGGLILVKCQSYVSSGHFWPGTVNTANAGIALGLTIHDWFEHLGDPQPQPKDRTRKCKPCNGKGCDQCENGRVKTEQQHGRSNHSTLIVFSKPKRRKKKA